jgi:hypothetical protein
VVQDLAVGRRSDPMNAESDEFLTVADIARTLKLNEQTARN